MSKTYILGNGGFAKEIFEQIFLQDKNYSFGGFIILKDKKAYLINDQGITPFTYEATASFVLGTGHKKWKSAFIEHFSRYYEKTIKHFPNIISSKAYVSHTSSMGIGNVLCAFSLINANAQIGSFNTINVYASINHDCIIGDNNILSPYASILGYCKVGDNNFLAAKAVITPTISIKDGNTISAGEVVFDDMANREFFQSGIITKKR
jgi:UDP-3-O-[3-hydroxymyristoyl] glucosamine N-acyltransferase